MRNCIVSLLEGICHGKEQGSREGARVVGRGGEERRGELWLTSAHRAPPAAASARIRTGRRGSEELEIKGRCRRPGRGRGTSSSIAEEVGRSPNRAAAGPSCSMRRRPVPLPSFPLCGAAPWQTGVAMTPLLPPFPHRFTFAGGRPPPVGRGAPPWQRWGAPAVASSSSSTGSGRGEP